MQQPPQSTLTPDLSRDTEATRRTLYDLVVQMQFSPVEDAGPGEWSGPTYTPDQYRLRMAAMVISNGMQVPEFLLFCAHYVIAHHRRLKDFRQVFRKGAREILAAAAKPVGPGFLFPESEQNRRRQAALDRFCTWAGDALHEDITGEKK